MVLLRVIFFFFFFFKQKTAYEMRISDWSSDVCSSDLMAVTVQGYLALDLVKKNNVELVKGVDRASTTTVSALRTAVTVAQALTNQKLVLEQITALNTTTANIIDSTGE